MCFGLIVLNYISGHTSFFEKKKKIQQKLMSLQLCPYESNVIVTESKQSQVDISVISSGSNINSIVAIVHIFIT